MKRLRQAISALLRLEHGITGLETAIILIAFVVVGSVFAYTVLSAGLFATEKGREAVHSGMGEVRSTIVTRGGMIGYKGSVDTTGNKTGDTDAVVKLDVTVGSALQGLPIDLTPPYKVDATNSNLTTSGLSSSLVIGFVDKNQVMKEAAWSVAFLGANDGDYSLEPGEKATITVWIVDYKYDAVAGLYYDLGTDSTDPFIDTSATLLKGFQAFSLELSPIQGNTLFLEKTVPQSLNAVMNLH